jgi:hypothetical protein
MDMSANQKLTAALEGWHRTIVLSHENADEFANAFIASPDCEECGDASLENIEAAAKAMYNEFKAEVRS